MDSNLKMKAPEAPSDMADSLSQLWCNAAAHVMQPAPHDRSLALQENFIKIVKSDTSPPSSKMDMDRGDTKPLPPWKTDDLKSWIWLQQAIHPELNYKRCFRKKWKLIPLKEISIGKWMKELKQKRKEDERLQKAEVHAAVSIASVAAALAAVAAENVKENQHNTTKEAAIASAAALVAAQCAQIAEDMGANREQLSTAMSSAMVATGVSDIITFTAAAATSLRGAATLKARPGRKERGDGGGHILPFEGHKGFEMDYDKYRAVLAKGSELKVRTADGRCKLRFVSVILNTQAKVLLRSKNRRSSLQAFTSTKESTITDLHEDSISEVDGPTSVVLKTSGGMMKLEMNDYDQYKLWLLTINHMLMLSTSFGGYELQYYRN
ncbi:VAN3-binding protein [Aristolochia californica]|uniref:VAN3-binding protein n=1 Tax=Aristolochia californica TaxID=171875 RepID=UPI0035DB9172